MKRKREKSYYIGRYYSPLLLLDDARWNRGCVRGWKATLLKGIRVLLMLLFGPWFLVPLLGVELLLFFHLSFMTAGDMKWEEGYLDEEGHEMYLPPVDTISPDTITELKDSLGTSRIELAPEN